jgi:hypothetical protein
VTCRKCWPLALLARVSSISVNSSLTPTEAGRRGRRHSDPEASQGGVREVVGAKKRVLSAAGRAAIVKAAKKRWAKVRKQAKKVTA